MFINKLGNVKCLTSKFYNYNVCVVYNSLFSTQTHQVCVRTLFFIFNRIEEIQPKVVFESSLGERSNKHDLMKRPVKGMLQEIIKMVAICPVSVKLCSLHFRLGTNSVTMLHYTLMAVNIIIFDLFINIFCSSNY